MAESMNNPTPVAQAPLARAGLRGAAWFSAAVAAAFCIVVGAIMAADYTRISVLDPLDTPALKTMKEQLGKDSSNQELRGQIRKLDLQVRGQYSRSRSRIETGRFLLLSGVTVMLLAGGIAMACQKRPPMPSKMGALPFATKAREGFLVQQLPKLTVAAVACILGGGLALLTVLKGTGAIWKPAPVELAGSPAQSDEYPSDDEVNRNWPNFRGPGGLGISPAADTPMQWDAKSGSGIVWKVPIPLAGNNSPVVWGDRVFLTGATGQKRSVFCFDAANGKLLWERPVDSGAKTNPDAEPPSDDTGYAASTAATDGRRVCAIFANGDLACFDFAGRGLWTKSLGQPESAYGHASSLLMDRGLVLVQYDQGSAEGNKSAMLAFHAQSGKPAWKAARDVDNSWSSPILFSLDGRRQLVTVARPWVIAYNPADGKELWRAKWLEGYADVAPSPAYAAGRIIVANAQASVAAIPADGSGDVTARLAWQASEGLPDICSPLAFDGLAMLVESGGGITCYDVATGKKVYQHNLQVAVNSSPVLAGGRIYLLDREGVAHILQAGREFKELGRSSLGEPCVTTPAFAGGRLYVRGQNHLFCIGKSR
jgi:outer membrane protein assembly factor BamB